MKSKADDVTNNFFLSQVYYLTVCTPQVNSLIYCGRLRYPSFLKTLFLMRTPCWALFGDLRILLDWDHPWKKNLRGGNRRSIAGVEKRVSGVRRRPTVRPRRRPISSRRPIYVLTSYRSWTDRSMAAQIPDQKMTRFSQCYEYTITQQQCLGHNSFCGYILSFLCRAAERLIACLVTERSWVGVPLGPWLFSLLYPLLRP